MFTSFSYFEDPQEDRRVVANVYCSLKPGGVFLLETHGKETLAHIFRERDWSETNGTFVLARTQGQPKLGLDGESLDTI